MGLAEFAIARRCRASSYLASISGRSPTGGERGRFLVLAITPDSLLDSVRPPAVVLDVEGAEVEVLFRGGESFGGDRPVIYLETGESTHAACERLLVAAGYTLTRSARTTGSAHPGRLGELLFR